MLQDSLLVPQALVKPKSFVGLMALYDSNYLRLLHLVPELDKLDGCFRSQVAGECDLHVDFLERSRYTLTLSLTYVFSIDCVEIAKPDIVTRVYLDGRQAEALQIGDEQRHAAFMEITAHHRHALDQRWRRNVILNKWLEYLLDQGHLILDR